MAGETTISLDKKTQLRLKNLGKKGDTYSKILNMLMDSYDSYQLEKETRIKTTSFVDASDEDIQITRITFPEPITLQEGDVLELAADMVAGKLISAKKSKERDGND